MRLAVVGFLLALTLPIGAQRAVLSTRPDTPFKLATFEAAGKVRVGLVLGTRILDIESANAVVVQAIDQRGGPAMPHRKLRNWREPHRDRQLLQDLKTDGASFAFDVAKPRSRRPLSIYNLLAVAANYKPAMFAPDGRSESGERRGSGQEDPVFFAKSPARAHRSDESYAVARAQHRLEGRARDHHQPAPGRRSAGAACSASASWRPQRSRQAAADRMFNSPNWFARRAAIARRRSAIHRAEEFVTNRRRSTSSPE
jgi:hypothetical protein